MARRVVLHVGLMKSGTTYLQRRLEGCREQLAERGVLFPGERWRDQVRAVVDVLGRDHVGPPVAGEWGRLVEQATAYDGDVLVSMEFLGPATPEQVRTVVDSFGATPVEVVITLRDLGRTVPAMWQEILQNGASVPWGEWVASLSGPGPTVGGFWRQFSMARIVETWAAVVGVDAVSLVTVPAPGAPPGLLWDRFSAATGLDLDGCADLELANTSLAAAPAELLRRLNLALERDSLSRTDYHHAVKFGLAKSRLAQEDGPPIGFDPPTWLRERAALMVERLAATGARVVGSLAELTPVPVPGVDPDAVGAATTYDRRVEELRQDVLDRIARTGP